MTRTAIILAGGEARRMGGQDKGLIMLGGQRLIDLVVERLSVQVDRVILSGAHDYGLGLDVLPDLDDGPKGPSAALFAAVRKYPSLDGFLTVPVDGPFFPAHLYERLAGDTSAIAAGPDRDHPTFAYWNTAALRQLFSGSKSKNWPLMEITESLNARRVKFRAESYFMNFNSPADLDVVLQPQS